MSEPANKKYKKVHGDFSHLAILTKSVLPVKVQLTFTHVSFRNNSLGKSVAIFSLAGSLHSSYVVLIDVNIAFTMDGDKIRLPIAEVLLCAADGKLASSKTQVYSTPYTAVFLPPFFTELSIIDRETSVEELLKIFAHSITKRQEDKKMSGRGDQ